MLPSAEQFAQHAGSALGVNNKTHVVVYDSQGIFSAPRVWMTFRTFGHENVSVLNGGLVAWKQANLPLETTKPASVTPSQFIAKLSPNLMRDFPFVDKLVRDKQVSKDNGLQIVDARSSPRFQGTVPEPRPGLAGGHMPGSRNIPFTDLLDPKTQCLLSDDELRQVFARANVDPLRPLVASCGSGVTACVIALAAFQLGNKSAAVYDGSWTEYASQPGALIECAKK
ncbi:3-mercaptopyruvate sulfurtransferase [Capsaspora owczarzaki ATCC 30864]|uniref:Sulfurtransferase n=2 Tax=Capsaspora owczarzaki (strain ATCC 30864) TaxID=595528 RepID=A0A0D2W154_CAPO3|nr:3-mercaptopyruvate sulfurtransferase [Capsaspora owczarzaki ATCC 30864]